MANYRIYGLDKDGHIRSGEDAAYPDDETMLEIAKSIVVAGRQIEVWQATRFVGAVSATGVRLSPKPASNNSPAPHAAI